MSQTVAAHSVLTSSHGGEVLSPPGRGSPPRRRRWLRASLATVFVAAVAAMAAGGYWIAALGPAPLGEGLAFSTLVRRPRRQAAAALHHPARTLAIAGDARARRSAVSHTAARLRGQALRRASRRRPARARPRVGAAGRPRPHRLRRLDHHHAGCAAARAPRRAQLHGEAAPNGARGRNRARALQGRNPRALSEPRALWRQSRRRARGLAGLFRQGAAPLDLGRGGVAGGLAAIAGAAPARPRERGRAPRPRPGARPRRRRRPRAGGRDRACPARAGAGGTQAHADAGAACGRRGGRGGARSPPSPPHHRRGAAGESRRAGARARPCARPRDFGCDPRGRSCDRRGAGARRLGRLFRRPPRRSGRYDGGGALAGLDAQAVHLWTGLRGRPHPSRHADRRSPDPFRRLRAGEFRSRVPGHGDRASRPAAVAERAGGRRARQGRRQPLRGPTRAGGRSGHAASGRSARARDGPRRRRASRSAISLRSMPGSRGSAPRSR